MQTRRVNVRINDVFKKSSSSLSNAQASKCDDATETVCSDETVCGQVTTGGATEVLEMFHMFRGK